MLWLDVDTIIRERSHGARSLDTFLHRFTEPALTGPIVVTYTRAQIESLLNDVEPYDWHAFFEKYVYHVAVHPPADELARAGWRIVYTERPNDVHHRSEQASDHGIIGWYAYGANLDADGVVKDVRENSPAWRAGLAPGMHVLAVNGQQFSSDVLEYAAQARAAFVVADLAHHDPNGLVSNALARLSRWRSLPASRANPRHERHARRDRRSSRRKREAERRNCGALGGT